MRTSNKQTNKQTIIVTDPPFNIGYHYNTYKDTLRDEDYLDMIARICKDIPAVLIHYPESLYRIAHYMNRFPTKVVSWVYNSALPREHRDIAFFDIKPDFKKITQPYKNPTDKRVRERIANGGTGRPLYDWWNINIVKNVSTEKTAHPCQMPEKVMENIIGILPDDVTIIDPFMGSGTTGVAVKRMNVLQTANRNFVGIELDEMYYNIACERIDKAETQLRVIDLLKGKR